MADMWMDVDTALAEVPVNLLPLIDDTDFKTRETAIAYNQAGMDLVWNFVTSAGAFTQTAVTPTASGNYDWTHQGDGIYTIEIPASGGASINNDTEGYGWFSGICTGVLPWRGPVIGFRAAGLNDLLCDSAYSTTRGLTGTALPAVAAEAAGGLFTRGTGAGQINQDANGRIDISLKAILGTTLTETAGQIAAAFKQFFDVASPTGTMKAITNVALVDTVTTYTGNTPQTGDSFARIGATGSGLTSLASATALATVDDFLDTEMAAVLAAVDTEVASALSDLSTLLTRLSAARAGYLDNLNVGGAVASSAEATAIQNNTRVVRVVPDVIERPDSGTATYRVELFLYDDTGNMEAPDSAPTIALVNQAGTDRSSRLDSTTMALVETGRYRAIYTADAVDTLEQLVWTFSVVEGGATRKYGNNSLIVDTTAVDFTAADRTKLDTLHDTRLTAARAGYLDELAAANIPADVDTLLARLTALRAGYLDELSAVNVPADVDTLLARLTSGRAANLDEVTPARMATLTDWIDGGRLDLLVDTLIARLTATRAANLDEITAARMATLTDWIDAGRLDLLLDAIKAKSDQLVFASGDVQARLSAVGNDLVHDEVIEGTLTHRQMQRIFLAALANILDGAATGTITMRDLLDTKNRITATVDSNGNRLSVTLDGT